MKRLDSYTRSLFPFGLWFIAIGIAFALLRGGMAFGWAEDASNPEVVDFAVSYALITLFSFIFGVWLAVGLSQLASRVFLYVLNISEKRIDELIGRVEEIYDKPLDMDGSIYSASSRKKSIVDVASYGYIFGFMLSCMTLVYAALYSYTYAGDPLPVTFDSGLVLRYAYAVGLISFVIAIGALLTISGRIALHWNRLIKLENEFDTLKSGALVIQEFAPASASMTDSIIKANANAMRFLAAGRT